MAGDIKSHPAIIQIFAKRLKKLSKEGDQYLALCPFHNDHNPSLKIGRDDKGQWVYNCFSCSAGGDALKFIREFDKISFSKATKILEEATGGDWEAAKALAEQTFKSIETIPAEEVPVEKYVKFEIALYNSQEAKDWLFTQRGITYEAARKCRFGFCQSLDAVTTKYDKEALKDIANSGWITFAAIEGDKVLCIEARSMVSKTTRIRTGMTNKVLFGVDSIAWDQPVYVVEGKLDMAIMVQAGFVSVSLPNATTNLTPEMRDKLMSASTIILAGDNDGAAGSAKMLKLYNDLQSRTYLIKWVDSKDANEAFIKTGRDLEGFKNLVDTLTLQAYSNPIPGVKSIQDILKNDESESSEDDPSRFRFSISPIDRMANIKPGSVVYLSATQTSTGKTCFTIQETLNAARKHDEVVLNYQTEMQDAEIGEIITANLLAKERNNIVRQDRLEAAKRLKGVLYYVGNNPNLNSSSEVLDLIEAGIRRVGATVVVLDHIHFICRNEADEIKAQSIAMQRIKRMAQKHMLKFFVVGQPRKPTQQTQGRAIEIYDAKGSESVVSDADVVYFLHREVIKNVTEETMDNLSPEVQVRCMKGRSRGKGSAFCKLFFLGKIATFREIIPIEEPKDRFDF